MLNFRTKLSHSTVWSQIVCGDLFGTWQSFPGAVDLCPGTLHAPSPLADGLPVIHKSPQSRRGRAAAAVFLLSEMADSRVLPWVREFMEDGNASVRWNALIALGQVLQGPLGDEGIALAKELLAKAETDHEQRLRERAIEIREQLA